MEMVIHFEISQIIEKPIENVFTFLSDFSNMPLWNYYIQNVIKTSEGQDKIGTIYEQKRPHGINLYKIIEYHKPVRVKVELQPPKPLQQYGFELQAINGQTQVVYKWQVDLRKYKLLKFIPDGVFKSCILSFARKHIIKNIKPATEQNFLKLKELLEKGQVILQDGGRSIFLTI